MNKTQLKDIDQHRHRTAWPCRGTFDTTNEEPTWWSTTNDRVTFAAAAATNIRCAQTAPQLHSDPCRYTAAFIRLHRQLWRPYSRITSVDHDKNTQGSPAADKDANLRYTA